jgi:hypothetical protein
MEKDYLFIAGISSECGQHFSFLFLSFSKGERQREWRKD